MTATEDDEYADVFPPDRFVRIRGVPVFDEHEGEGHGGKPKKVTAADLRRIADACNAKFTARGVATALTLGHTKDDPKTKESEQPLPVGWAVNFRVGDLLKTGRKALYCDWYVRRRHAHVIEDYPHRSVEWWRSRDDLNPIALLRTAPERDLPVIKYEQSAADDDSVYRYTFTPPPTPTPTDETMPDEKTDVMTDAVAGETATAKSTEAQIKELSAQVAKITQFMEQLLSMVGDEGGDQDGDDLLGPADDGDDFGDGDDTETDDEDDKPKAKAKDGGDDKKPAADAKKSDDEPAKFEAAYAGPGNTFTPETKTKMSRTDDKTDYNRVVAEAVEKATSIYKRENDDLRAHYNRSLAKEAVAELEAAGVDFGTADEREEEVTLFASLLREDRTKASFDAHKAKVLKKYRRKPDPTPDSKAVAEVAKYARTDAAPADFNGIHSVEQLHSFLAAHTEAVTRGQTPPTKEQWLQSQQTKA